jgi:hypothetical protein
MSRRTNWSPEEDERMLNAINDMPSRLAFQQKAVLIVRSGILPGRTVHAIVARNEKLELAKQVQSDVDLPDVRHVWTSEDEEILRNYMNEHHDESLVKIAFKLVSSHKVVGHTARAVVQRMREMLVGTTGKPDPRAWTAEENHVLWEFISEGPQDNIRSKVIALVQSGKIARHTVAAIESRMYLIKSMMATGATLDDIKSTKPFVTLPAPPTVKRLKVKPKKTWGGPAKLWTQNEDNIVKDYHDAHPYDTLNEMANSLMSVLPGRTEKAIVARICMMRNTVLAGYNVMEGGQFVRRYKNIPSRAEIQRDIVENEGPGVYVINKGYEEVGREEFSETDYEEEEEEEGHGDLEPVPSKSHKFTVARMMKVTASREDGSFYVKTVPKTIGEVYVGEPPGKDDIEALLVPQYGGGEYSVINQTTKKVHKRFKFDGPPKDPDASEPSPTGVLDDDKRPLMMVMALLDRARGNPEAWKRIFPKALAAAEIVCADIDTARKELKELVRYREAEQVRQKKEVDEFDAQWAGIDEALKAEKLIDRELKRRD